LNRRKRELDDASRKKEDNPEARGEKRMVLVPLGERMNPAALVPYRGRGTSPKERKR